MPKISVIIPCYKAQPFIRRCLDSLLCQTETDWEAVCIDDESPDETGAILEEYSEQDPRFKVYHQLNAGVSASRNFAVEKAEGEYVIFIDADDFIHPQTMEICLLTARRFKADMVAYTYNREYRTQHIIRHLLHMGDREEISYEQYDPENVSTFTTDNIYDWVTEYSKPKDIDPKWAVKHCQAWRCMYAAKLVKSVRFIFGIAYEDFPWWGEVLLKVNRTAIINLPLYYYYPNKTSYIFTASQEHRVESLRKAIAASENTYENAPEYKKHKWEQNFLVPFRAKLERKSKKL